MRNILVIALSLFSVISFGQTLQDTVKVQPLSEFPEISLVSGDGTVIPVQFIRNDSSLWGRVDKDDLKTFILANIGAIGDVLITSPTDSSILIYDQANSRWIDAPYPSISGGSGVSDGVITGASYNAGTQNIDVTVASPGTSFSFSVAGLLDNTDTQDLTLISNILSLTDGGSVDLSGYLDNTDDQTLSLAGTTLSIEDGNSVDLSGLGGSGTDDQTLTLTGNTLSIEDGNSVDLSDYLDNTDAQDLSLSGNTLSLTGDATSVDISGISVSWNNLTDIPAGFADNVDNVSSEGTGDGVTTSGLYNAVTEAIDFTVTGAADYSVSVSALLDNTDNQDLSLSGNTLSLTGDATTVDLSNYLDNTDDQTIDVFAFDGTNLTLSLESDGEATKSIDLSSLSTNTTYDFIQLNTAFVNTDFSIGEIGWSENDEVRIGILDNYDFAVGQDMYKTVHNTTASAIPAGTAVMMTGADGNSSVFTIAPMTYPAIGAEYLIGVTAVDIAAGGTGVAVQNGNVRGLDIDAAGWSAGDVLYLDEVSAGGLTTTPGDVLVAAVTSAGPNGSIYVRPDFYTGLSQAEADAVGAMVTGNTETLIDVTYQADNTIDFVVNDDLSLYDNTTSGFLTSEVDGSVTNEIQDLQSVTDQGATTTNDIIMSNSAIDFFGNDVTEPQFIVPGTSNIDLNLRMPTANGWNVTTFQRTSNGTLNTPPEANNNANTLLSFTPIADYGHQLAFNNNSNDVAELYYRQQYSGGFGEWKKILTSENYQTLTLDANTLDLTNGGSVDLSEYLDNTDSQTLSLSGTTLSITGGNDVDLSLVQDGIGTDDQTLQEVTDQGATTTNNIIIDDAATLYQTEIGPSIINLARQTGSYTTRFYVDGDITKYDSRNGHLFYDNSVLKASIDLRGITSGGTAIGSSDSYANLYNGDGSYISQTIGGGATYPYNGYGNLIIAPRSNAARDIVFASQADAGGGVIETKAVIKGQTGRLGLRTTSPSYLLHVNGTVGFENISDGSSFDQILARNSTTGEIGFTTDQTGTDDQQIFFNSETNVLSIESANNVDLSSLASGAGLSWDDQTEVVIAPFTNNTYDVPSTFITAADPNKRYFDVSLRTDGLTANGNSTMELPTLNLVNYVGYLVSVSCESIGSQSCVISNIRGGSYSMIDGEIITLKVAIGTSAGFDTYEWVATDDVTASIPEPQTLSWSAGTDRNDEITLSDGGGTITVTDDQQLSWNSLTNVLSLTNSATADLNDLLQGIIISGNSVVIQGGPAGANTVPIVNTVESVTSTNTDAIVNLQGSYNRIAQIDLTASTGAVTLSVSNPVSGGVYTFHFQNVTSTDLTFPGTFLDAAGSTLGTVPMTANNWYTCYYDGSNYHCK